MELDRLVAQADGFGSAFWKDFYAAAADLFVDDPFPFLNLGYADPDAPHPSPAGPDVAERLSWALYEHALAGIELTGRTVVEVGCGRGGSCARIAREHDPAEVVGVDLSAELVALCARLYGQPGLRFEQADAAALPLADASVDVVVNVESSHCYASRPAFFAEVARVLRPGGQLALADLLFVDHSPETIEAGLAGAGLTVTRRSDITAAVIAARDVVSDSAAFRERLARAIPRPEDAAAFGELYFLAGSRYYDALVDGSFAYWSWTVEKPG